MSKESQDRRSTTFGTPVTPQTPQNWWLCPTSTPCKIWVMLHPFSYTRICQHSQVRVVPYGMHVCVTSKACCTLTFKQRPPGCAPMVCAQGGLCLQGRKQQKKAAGRGEEISESTKEIQGAVRIAEKTVSQIPRGMGRWGKNQQSFKKWRLAPSASAPRIAGMQQGSTTGEVGEAGELTALILLQGIPG